MTSTDERVEDIGLAPNVIDDWKRRIGVGYESSAAEPVRFSGRNGMHEYRHNVRLGVREPDHFDALSYRRTLSLIGVFCVLHTPVRVERNEDLIIEQPADELLVGVHSLRGRTFIEQGGTTRAYSPGQLVTVNNASPYVQTNHAIADPAGLVIPLELLSDRRDTAERTRRPRPSHSALSRATAAFIRRFAADVAADGGAVPDEETEVAAIELVRAALGTHDDHHDLNGNGVFVRQAAVELIERNHRDPDFSPESICRALHLSRRQLYRHFEATQESLASLIADRRLRTAHDLLLDKTELSVAEVAVASGFPSTATMRNRFRTRYNRSPRETRFISAPEEVSGLPSA